MIYNRETRFKKVKEQPKKEATVEVAPKVVDEANDNLEEMNFFKLRALAIEKGVDVEVHKTKAAILEQLRGN